MEQHELFDVTVIGGGPAGLYSTFYSGLREMKTKLIEFQPVLGGKIHVYPEKMIWDVGGQTPITGAKLIEQLVEQGKTFDPEIVLNEKIVSMVKEDGIFVLTAESGRVHYSKTVIVAVGGGILKPQKLTIEGAERYEVSNLNYTVKSLQHFLGKTVIISGGGNSAIDWANELERVAKQVYLTYRKDCLPAHEAQVTQLANSSVICFLNTSISKLIASNDHEKIQCVELTNCATGETANLQIDEVVISHGYEQDAELLASSELDIELVDGFYVKGTASSESNVPGLYAAGDILKHDGKVNLITGAFQDAANAVNRAKQHIQPEAGAVAMVSSHNEVFKERNRELIQEMFGTKQAVQ
ncbi:NAD(P)/FAD-dependent oxidoreductase [Exiguobacterium flavidum]|uniref:NAD(P)/FAD-dependent oxidoreductase n=1 Tax=Exiguobacterium flavidum TaxID=2184695 RepID=UPI000DF770B7|nr:NAD(P)/FAD-dependent oxidoreductase [Exiguobacterium flavidum]